MFRKKKWEYLRRAAGFSIAYTDKDIEENPTWLRELGDRGWELVSVNEIEQLRDRYGPRFIWTFKRPK